MSYHTIIEEVLSLLTRTPKLTLLGDSDIVLNLGGGGGGCDGGVI